MSGAELMRTITTAFAHGEVKPLMAALHPEVVWKSASKYPGLFSFGGKYKDRMGVVEVLSKIATRYTFVRFQPKEIAEQGDTVWGLFDAKLTYTAPKSPPKTVNVEIAIRWKLRDGKIIEHQAFFDTVSVLIQQGKLSENVVTQP